MNPTDEQQGSADELVESSNTESAPDWTPKRGKGPILAALLVLAGLAYGVWKFVFEVHTDPTKVLVVVETHTLEGTRGAWWGAKGKVSARYADAMAKELETLGFTAYSGADPELLEAMEQTRSLDEIATLARSRGIRWIISGEIRNTAKMPIQGASKALFDLVVTAQLGLIDADTATTTAPEATRIDLGAPDFFVRRQSDFETALEKHNMGLLVKRHVADVARALASTPGLASYASTNQESSKATIVAGKLQPLFGLARRYELAIEARNKQLTEDTEKVQSRKPHPSSTVLTPMDANELFVGEASDGSVVSLLEARETFFSAKAGRVVNSTATDELFITSLDGKVRKRLFRTYNVFSHPQISADGNWVGLVVDHHGRGTSLVRIATETGKAEEVFLAAEGAYLSDVTPSSDGSKFVFWAASCDDCPKEVQVIAFGEEKPRQLLSAEETREIRSLPRWSSDASTLYFDSTREGFTRSIWSVELSSGTFSPLAGEAYPPVAGDQAKIDEATEVVDETPPEYSLVAVSPSEATLLLREHRRDHGRSTYHLTELHIASKSLTERSEIPRTVGKFRFSRDGQWLVFGIRGKANSDDPVAGDWEIVLVHRKSGERKALTSNSSDEHFLDVSRTASHVFYRTTSQSYSRPCGDKCRRIHTLSL